MFSALKICTYLAVICFVLAQTGRESGGRALREDKRWQDVGNGVENHNSALENSITRMNANQSALLWNFALSDVSGQPYPPSVDGSVVYFDGMAFFADSLGSVYSLYGNNGSLAWKQNCSTGITTGTIEAFRKTPFVDSVRVCVSARNVFCLSSRTGAIIWRQSNDGDQTSVGPDGRLTEYYTTSGDITSVDGRLFVAHASIQNTITRAMLVNPNNQDLTARGGVSAFNLETGVVLWRFYTTSDQAQPNPQYGAGGGIYSSPAIDVLSQTLFIGSGQSYEPPASPLTDSLLAIDYVTGKLKWSYQTRVGDVYSQFYAGPDRDVNTHPNIIEVVAQRIGDVVPRIYRLVGVGTKNGDYFLFETVQDNPSTPDIFAAVNVELGSSIGGFQATPAFHNGILYCATHASVLANGTRVPTQASNFFSLSTRVTAIDVQALIEGRPYIKWRVDNPANFLDFTFGDVAYSEGVVYTASFNGQLRGLNSATGEQVFVRVPQPNGFQGFANTPIHGGPIIVDGKIIISYGSAFSGVFVKGGVAAYGFPYARPQRYSSNIVVPPAGQPGCNLGYQRCNDDRSTFQTCTYTNAGGDTDFGATQQCAPGTQCRPFMANYIICDY